MLRHLRRILRGGSAGNERLTAVIGLVLLVTLAAEGVTILRIGRLLTLHEFIGMLLIPPVALKLASTGWRFRGYYLRLPAYVEKGPPQIVLRVLVAPVLVLSTLVVFGSGVALLATGERRGPLVGVHKASFVVWGVAFALHVLAYVLRLPGLLADDRRGRVAGRAVRYGLVIASIAIGVAIAAATVHLDIDIDLD
jgi:hypothetical protein